MDGLQKGRGEFSLGQGSTPGMIKNSPRWFGLGVLSLLAIRTCQQPLAKAGLSSLCKQAGRIAPKRMLQKGQDQPSALAQSSRCHFMCLWTDAFPDIEKQRTTHLELSLPFHCLFQALMSFCLKWTKKP